jgi:hypothetical protein
MRSILLMLMFCCASANATVVTVDFEEITDFTIYYSDFNSSSYNFSIESGTMVITPYGGGPYLSMSGTLDGWSTLTMKHQNDSVFSLLQFDLNQLHVSDGSGALNVELQITGYQTGGGQVSTILYSADAGGTILLSGFDNLEYVDFHLVGDYNPVSTSEGGYWPVASMDNFAATVPIPAAVWLFGSGLAGLGFMRRKKA